MRATSRDRSVKRATRHDEEVEWAERDRVAPFHLDAERPVEAEEQLVLVVAMPGELALEARDANDRVVDLRDVARTPRLGELVGDGAQ